MDYGSTSLWIHPVLYGLGKYIVMDPPCNTGIREVIILYPPCALWIKEVHHYGSTVTFMVWGSTSLLIHPVLYGLWKYIVMDPPCTVWTGEVHHYGSTLYCMDWGSTCYGSTLCCMDYGSTSLWIHPVLYGLGKYIFMDPPCVVWIKEVHPVIEV